jgi:PAS domain S-box-containing protein
MADADARERPWFHRLVSVEWGPYALASGLAIAAELIRLSFRPLQVHVSYLLFLAAVSISALIGGAGPGLLAFVLGGLAGIYPSSTLGLGIGVIGPAEASRLIVFSALALMVVWVAVKIRRTRQIQTALLSGLGDAAVETDAKGMVVFLNPAGEALSGCERNYAVGKPIGEVLPFTYIGADKQIEDPLQSVLSLGRNVDLTNGVVLRSMDGALRRIEGAARPVRDHAGRVKGMTVFFRDIASGREPQNERRQDETIEAFARLARGVAQDFSNSLTVITGHAELLLSRADVQADSLLREGAEEILRASEKAAGMTRELLVFGNTHLAQAPPAEATSVVSYQPKREAAAIRNAATILVAERDKGVRALIGAVLRKKGYVVLEAGGGIDAVAIVAEQLNELDLIVADATMTVMGEHGLIERLTMLRPELKILYLHGSSDTLSWTSEHANGRVRFLSKPFSARDFLERVESLLSG